MMQLFMYLLNKLSLISNFYYRNSLFVEFFKRLSIMSHVVCITKVYKLAFYRFIGCNTNLQEVIFGLFFLYNLDNFLVCWNSHIFFTCLNWPHFSILHLVSTNICYICVDLFFCNRDKIKNTRVLLV